MGISDGAVPIPLRMRNLALRLLTGDQAEPQEVILLEIRRVR